MKPPPNDPSHWKSILDVIHGEQDTCTFHPSLVHVTLTSIDTGHRCSVVHGFSLWNETSTSYQILWEWIWLVSDWEYFRGYELIGPAQLCLLIKGLLSAGLVEYPQLHSQLSHTGFTYTALLQEIHDLRTSEFDTWDKQDWLCLQCIMEIIKSHMHLWLLERKRKGKFIMYLTRHSWPASAGTTIHEDCWYVTSLWFIATSSWWQE